MPTPLPVCLSCRRPLDSEPDDALTLRLDGREFLEVARDLAAETSKDRASQAVLHELLRGLCRTCGRALYPAR